MSVDPHYEYVELLLPLGGAWNYLRFQDLSSREVPIDAYGDVKFVTTTQK